MIRQLIPSELKVFYQVAKRWIIDFGVDFQSCTYGQIEVPSQFSITQDIKKSTLYENKIHNLKVASSRIEQFVILPGQSFSFWRIVGKANAKNGFKVGRNIIAGEMKEDFGGGLCQLGGIIYHLALTAGLQITERHNHSVDFYTDESRFTPLGCDAAVAYGYKDLRLKSNFDKPISFRFDVKDMSIQCSLHTELEITPKVLNFVIEKTVNSTTVIGFDKTGNQVNKSIYLNK
jgi:vancomycin resistance protein VanW